jgi:hypothetical protein
VQFSFDSKKLNKTRRQLTDKWKDEAVKAKQLRRKEKIDKERDAEEKRQKEQAEKENKSKRGREREPPV